MHTKFHFGIILHVVYRRERERDLVEKAKREDCWFVYFLVMKLIVFYVNEFFLIKRV
jgi:hypothetical protein